MFDWGGGGGDTKIVRIKVYFLCLFYAFLFVFVFSLLHSAVNHDFVGGEKLYLYPTKFKVWDL